MQSAISCKRNETEEEISSGIWTCKTCCCPSRKTGCPGEFTPWYITAELEYLHQYLFILNWHSYLFFFSQLNLIQVTYYQIANLMTNNLGFTFRTKSFYQYITVDSLLWIYILYYIIYVTIYYTITIKYSIYRCIKLFTHGGPQMLNHLWNHHFISLATFSYFQSMQM